MAKTVRVNDIEISYWKQFPEFIQNDSCFSSYQVENKYSGNI